MSVLEFEACRLSDLADEFALIADIGVEIAGRDPDETQRKLRFQAVAGMQAVVGRHEGEIKAFMSVGDARRSINWAKEIPLMMHLQKRGAWPLYAVDNVFIRRAFWKTGSQLALSRAVATHILANGGAWMLLYGYPSDAMNDYSLKQPGSELLTGFVDFNGRQVGIRNLAVYLAGTSPVFKGPSPIAPQ